MALSEGKHGRLAVRFEVLSPHLDERQRRLLLATEARLLGHGGVRAVARAAGVSETTVRRGVFELEAGETTASAGRTRRPGGGRKRAEQVDPALLPALLALVEPDERGDPMSPLRWTTKSLQILADELTGQGHPVSAMTVGRLLKDNGFSLQAQAKTLEGEQHPNRDAQFRYINEQVKRHQADDEPVISVDTKKKEMLGQLPNPGRQWRPKGDPVRVDDHSFFSGPTGEAAIPYGIYDLSADTGWVNVGVDHDTSVFAVASIRRWWQARGRHDYPRASQLLITADAGGSNGYRYRLWKAELAKFAAETGLAVTVCHFPPGTSKWNKIEHRLFSHITMNLGIAVSKAQLKSLPIEYHDTHGTWNYTVRPDGPCDGEPIPLTDRDAARRRVLDLLAEPALTGMSREDLTALAGKLTPELGPLREERLHRKRGGPRRHGAGDNKRPVLAPADRILLSVIYLRHVSSQNLLAEMLGLCQRTLGPSIKEIRRLLQEHSISITPTTLCFSSSQELEDFVRSGTPVTARLQRTHHLADPALTGMDRTELASLIDQLSLQQAALIERRHHQHRGGPRQPGTRGGVFRQKITDAERLLAAVLYERKLGTRQVLADTFGVSLGTLNNALKDAQPVLREAGITLPPAPTRFATGAELLASIDSNTPTG